MCILANSFSISAHIHLCINPNCPWKFLMAVKGLKAAWKNVKDHQRIWRIMEGYEWPWKSPLDPEILLNTMRCPLKRVQYTHHKRQNFMSPKLTWSKWHVNDFFALNQIWCKIDVVAIYEDFKKLRVSQNPPAAILSFVQMILKTVWLSAEAR